MDFSIRPFIIKDFEQALSLWNRTEGMGLSGADTKSEISKFLKKHKGLCFSAFQAEQLIGTILCGEDGRRGYIYHLAVDKRYQKLRLGKKLVEQSIAGLHAKGIQKCHLFVIADNEVGMQFWQQIGWELRDDIEVMSLEIRH